MPINIDSANPVGTMAVSDFPANERNSRLATETAISKEHSYAVGGITANQVVHTFEIGARVADRDARSAEFDGNAGALFVVNDMPGTHELGQLLVQVYGGATPYDANDWTTLVYELKDIDNQWTKGQCGEWYDLIEGANVASDWTLANSFKLDPTTSFTLDNPSLPDHSNEEFQTAIYTITQGGTGSNAITWGSLFRGAFGASEAAGGMPELSTSVGAVDVIYCTLLPTGHIAVSILSGLDLT